MEELQPEEVYRSLYGFDLDRIGVQWLTRAQLRALFWTMERDRDILLYGLMAETGAKLGEILSLEGVAGDHLPLPRRNIPVSGLPFELQDLLSLLPVSLTSRQAERRIVALAEAAGVTGVTCHTLRISYAVHFLASGGQESDLAWILGYRDARGIRRLLQLEPQRNGFRCLGVVASNVRRKGSSIR